MHKKKFIRYGPLVGAIIFAIIVSLMSMGCAPMTRQALIDMSEQEIKDTDAMRAAARNFLDAWPIHSGLIAGALGDRIKEMPASAVEAMKELDDLAKKKADLSDFDLGKSLGLRIRLLAATVREALRATAPEILRIVQMGF